MSRKELEAQAFNIIANSKEYIDVPTDDIWKEIHKTTDRQLEKFLEELEED